MAHFIHVDTIMYNQFKLSYEIVQQQQDTFLKIYITAAVVHKTGIVYKGC